MRQVEEYCPPVEHDRRIRREYRSALVVLTFWVGVFLVCFWITLRDYLLERCLWLAPVVFAASPILLVLWSVPCLRELRGTQAQLKSHLTTSIERHSVES